MKQTPMMQQYFDIKHRYPNELLFFRLGDFYELFYEDAIIASRELNITLTGRNAGQEDKAPMCGVPYHAAEGYINKLIKKGYKVAICEQVEDPKEAKGIVKRDVIRVITPGTVMTEHGTEARENNFLALFYEVKADMIILFADITTGELIWERVKSANVNSMCDALTMYRPSELVVAGQTEIPKGVQDFMNTQLSSMTLSPYVPTLDSSEVRQLAIHQFSSLGLMEEDVMEAFGYMLSYLQSIIKTDISHLNYVHQLSVGDRMVLDTASLRHLEISRNLRDGSTKGTLLAILDHTETPMGARLLKQWVESPLMDVRHIQYRQRAIGELVDIPIMKERIRESLQSIFDFERILSRVETGSVSPRDLVSLRESLGVLPSLKAALEGANSNGLIDLEGAIETHRTIYDVLDRAILDQPALTLKDGKVIKEGFNEELDELRSLATNTQEWLQKLENDVKEKTGIRLKTGYNKVFGYYFEVTHAQAADVPDYFIRKQTLTNAERYITPELKEFEIKILSAKEKIVALEQLLFQDVRAVIKEAVQAIQKTARAIAELDVFISLSTIAYERQYICPTLVTNGQITIRDGRHPVIEEFLSREIFVPNDIVLNHDNEEFLLITGPNMAGKSTYMRQVAILMIMAQIGSFIPAREATISPVDRVFTRVGASDDISTGQSTFMVEMKEVAYILEHATSHSLVILDEIGRGTSTFDGLSIARAVVEYVCKQIHCKTLFATHYHELIDLEKEYGKLKNYTVAVKERGKDIAFLRRIIRGGADRSYGIHVARLAGLPSSVLKRAEQILEDLERTSEGSALGIGYSSSSQRAGKGTSQSASIGSSQLISPEDGPKRGAESTYFVGEGHEKSAHTSMMNPTMDSLFSTSVVDQLLNLDVLSMTPIEALNRLYQLQEEARKGGGK